MFISVTIYGKILFEIVDDLVHSSTVCIYVNDDKRSNKNQSCSFILLWCQNGWYLTSFMIWYMILMKRLPCFIYCNIHVIFVNYDLFETDPVQYIWYKTLIIYTTTNNILPGADNCDIRSDS